MEWRLDERYFMASPHDLVELVEFVRNHGDSFRILEIKVAEEQSIPINHWVDIGVLDAKGKFLYLQKRKIDQHKTDFTVTVE
jgi:hypothetical protein